MLRPPSRAGQHPHGNYHNNRFQHPMNNRKGNSCAMENSNINNVSAMSSIGYSSDNDTTKSSLDGSMSEEKAKELADDKKAAINDENEPEWYSVPATLNDFVELHGFEEGMEIPTPEKKSNNRSPNQNGYGTASLAYRRSGYGQNRYNQNQNRANGNYNNNNQQYYQNAGYQQQQQHQQQYANQQYGSYQNQGYSNNPQRFRNPLHFQKQQPQSPTYPNPRINPFFDLWKQSHATNENCSFQAMMAQRMSSVPANLPSISDIEHTMKSSNYLSALMKGQQQRPMPTISHSVPQFFNNWPQQSSPTANNEGFGNMHMPTQEQLQQHTTEIMRNAILRKTQQQKQQQQQYQDEKPYFR